MYQDKKTDSHKRCFSGFTLIELLLVVVLISILSGIILSVVNIGGIRSKSRDAQRAGDLKRVQTALELYFTDFRGYPTNTNWLHIKTGNGGILTTDLEGTYIQNLLQDPRDTDPVSACGQSQYGYYYRTDSCSGSGCRAGRYVLMTPMETNTAATASACNTIANCTSGAIAGCNYAAPCYCVENPL